jgi:nucleoside-diphosphate-sugar epimerase
MTHPAQKTALIIGASGSFGSHAAVAMIKHGWRIRALARDPEAAARKTGDRMPIDWIKGDAMNAADVLVASEGVSVIVHAANPPGYRNWAGLVAPMMANTIAAAAARQARIVLPGNVYNFAPNSGANIAENAPQQPVTRKGKIRVEMEEILKAATAQGVKGLVLRAGDFFGPAAPNSALGWLTIRRGGRVRSVYLPGPAEVGHAYAYMPDLGETLARLLDREADLADYEVFHFRGHYLDHNGELGLAIRRVTGQPKLPLPKFPWILPIALSPFVETFRELLEMRYLWNRPIGLSNAKLVKFLGEEPHTSLDNALRATLADMDALPEPAYAPPAASRSSSAMAPTM